MQLTAKFQCHFSQKQDKPQFVWSHKILQIAKAILREKNKVGGNILPDFRPCYQTIVTKTGWCRHKNRHRSREWNTEFRKKLLPMLSINLWQKNKKYTRKRASSISGAGKMDIHMWKDETMFLHHTQKSTQSGLKTYGKP